MGSKFSTPPMPQTVSGQGHVTPPEGMRRIPTVSVIVLCRNEEDHIATCVKSILAQDGSIADFEVIVVDGMSEDGTRGIVAEDRDTRSQSSNHR